MVCRETEDSWLSLRLTEMPDILLTGVSTYSHDLDFVSDSLPMSLGWANLSVPQQRTDDRRGWSPTTSCGNGDNLWFRVQG